MHPRLLPIMPLTLTAALLAGCGGGGHGTALPSALGSSGNAASVPSGSGSMSMSISIPAKTTASTARLPQYLPSNVASMTIAITQGSTPYATHTIQLGAGDPGCSATAPVTCTATFQVPIGNDTFNLSSFDSSNNAISHALVTKAIVAGVNNLPVTLNGIVKELAIVPAAPDFSIYEGTTSKGNTQTGSITALDADGNTIVGIFDSPLSITADGTLFTVQGGSATVDTSADTFTYGYNLPDPYTGNPTFSAGSTVFLAQPKIDNAKTLVGFYSVGSIALWYDFADTDASLFTTAAGHVSSWKDRNGSTNTVSQALPAAQPIIAQGSFTHNAMQNTLQNVTFSAGQCLVSATGFPAHEYTILIAAVGSGSPGTLVGPFGTPATYSHSITMPDASDIDLIDHGAAGPTLTGLALAAPAPNNSYYLSAEVQPDASDSATLQFHSSAISAGPITAPLAPASGTRDPGFALNAGSGLCGASSAANSLGEVIVLDHVASANELLALQEYLHRKWDI
jgi:hypothetical protein